MTVRPRFLQGFLVLLMVGDAYSASPTIVVSKRRQAAMDRDLMEVSVPQLERFYAKHKYSVTQVVNWYLDRIQRYNAIYRAIETVPENAALTIAQSEDREPTRRGALWGVPIVIKANTSIKGMVTTDGWKGFTVAGHELIAPADAPVVAKLRAAGAVIIGRSNMPDFAASDTNRSTSFGRTGNAYDVRFSPGGSSGGTVTAITANMALLGTGTDTANSIRMPASTSAVVGLLPTRGLVSISGIAPLDWLLDNTGPIARNVTDVAIALGVMAGEDAADFRTVGSRAKAQAGPYTQYLKADALKGKRLGVPAFILKQDLLQPETRALFLEAAERLRAAGAEVVMDDGLLTEGFPAAVRKINTRPYRFEGTQAFLKSFGPAQVEALPAVLTGEGNGTVQVKLEADPNAEAGYFSPQREALALYQDTLEHWHLNGLVYPAAQMPPPDETMPQDGRLSSGPHSATGWVNRIGVPAIVVPGGFYKVGLPFGLEFSARPWKDGDLLGWAYAFEQATRFRKPPVLVETGLFR